MHRGWMDNPVFKREAFTDAQAWIWLIEQASYQPHKIRYGNKIIEVGRGQVPTSYRNLKETFRWGSQRIAAYLAILEQDGMLERKTGTGFLVITICNYEKYQRPLINMGTQPGTPPGTVSGTQPGTNINKGERKENKNTYDSGFEEFWKIYPRREGKKEAYRAYLKAIQGGTSHEALIRAAGQCAAHHRSRATEKQFIKTPSHWLNAGCWDDELTAKPNGEYAKHNVGVA